MAHSSPHYPLPLQVTSGASYETNWISRVRYRRLGRTGLEVSEIGLGALEIGRDWGFQPDGNVHRPDEAEALRLVHAAIDLGITFIDTAPAYQLSEERLGKALRGRRNDVILATKVGEHYSDERGFWLDYGPEAVQKSVEQSLRRLQTDVIDLLQIHSASPEVIETGETLAAMKRFQEAGHVRFLGISGGEDAALAAIRDGGFDTVQVVYNIFERQAERRVFPEALNRDIGTIIMVPLAHGALTSKHQNGDPNSDEYRRGRRLAPLVREGQSMVQAALRFILTNSAVSTVIAGTRKIEHLRSNLDAADAELSTDDIELIENLI